MNRDTLPVVLCVDDEERVLEGLVLHLRKNYQVHTALGGELALRKLEELGGAAVIVSDMRMPKMDGATLLSQVMRLYPDTSRILLTGEASRDNVVNAVNEGQIFRFLIKPCPPDRLKSAIDAGVRQHRLASSERVLLQETLMGSIRALVDVLSMTNPVAFGRASRVTRLAMSIAGALGHKEFWELEAAAMLSQLGYLSLPAELVEKLYNGQQLTPEEKILADGVPKAAGRLLGHIPRIESVLQILSTLDGDSESHAKALEGRIGVGARILMLVLDYDSLVTHGRDMDVAVQALRSRGSRYDQAMLARLAESLGAHKLDGEFREVPVRYLRPGMTIMADLRTPAGMLLVARGFEVAESFMERMRNFAPAVLDETVQVLVPRSTAKQTSAG